jgi:hypothetical protein
MVKGEMQRRLKLGAWQLLGQHAAPNTCARWRSRDMICLCQVACLLGRMGRSWTGRLQYHGGEYRYVWYSECYIIQSGYSMRMV